ncbi:hypothetical protein B0H21DRAFT_749773 [Amylocystis lapponica]|nr:hypothetical protein B0H21DRAFT_749773 [Amylocystis lapponica]
MAGVPPTLTTETGIPADEWARTTTTAAFAPAPTFSTVPPPGVQRSTLERADSTPGSEFPGAFPKTRSHTPHSYDSGVSSSTGISHGPDVDSNAESNAALDLSSLTNRAMQSVTDAAQSVSSTASEYIPKMVDTVSSYMPGNGTGNAFAHDDPHATSMPSSELQGAASGERVSGVGALPGSIAEKSVSRLPDERSGVQGLQQSAPVSQQPLSGATYPTAPYEPTTLATVPPVPPPKETPLSMPTQELHGAHSSEHQDGAGALPGRANERGVAMLPDETHGGVGATGATSSAVGTHPRTYESSPDAMPSREKEGNESLGQAVGGVGALPGRGNEVGVARLPDEREPEDQGRTGAAGKAQHAKEGVKETAKKATGHGSEDQVSSESCSAGDQTNGQETRMNLLRANVTPREYSLGAPDAQWRGVGVGEGYKEGHDVDIGPDHEQREDESIYHPAKLHPVTNGAPAQSHEGTQASSETHDAAARRDSLSETHKKVGFMGKMRGEAKILLGKVEGKSGKDKVEEGRKIKAGEI